MIQLERPPEPESLTRNRSKWTIRWVNILQDGKELDWATRAAKNALKPALTEFSYGKCAFCEGTLGVTAYLQIEHYYAKTAEPHRVFEWENLFPSCGICNPSKGNLDHKGRLLKPDAENPEPLLWLDPGTGELQPHPNLDDEQKQRVLETITAYGLQRGKLCAARIEMMDRVNRWLARIDGESKMSPECRQEWDEMINPSTPWKFVIRHVLTLKGQPALAEIDRQTFLRRA
ncbi:MAG TPA: hypothetical protein VNW97_17465 [Candidatus Saccharimonadales bacterium]|nr:hypothetical protein [Candidatus Saccharimonadales bacterium]